MAADETTSDLSQLLAALAAGARAVQGLPLEDDFDFESSFPEFAAALQTSQSSLVDTLSSLLPDILPTVDDIQDISDPLLWEQCADACDVLVEQLEQHLQDKSSLSEWSTTVRQASQKSFSRMLQGLVDMEKPQNVYNIKPQTSRMEPFVPRIQQKPNAIVPLDLTLKPGHGLETRFGDLRTISVPDDVVAPSHHVPHVYQQEIEQFQYTSQQLQATPQEEGLIPTVEPLQATWIDTVAALQELAVQLSKVDKIAMDLEAHNYRSFSGIVCLMQISIRNKNDAMDNYLIDTLQLFHELHNVLSPILTNPKIVKVMHGADSDIQWLQRDFGLYIVNLFDTGRAARALRLPSAGYAHLLQKYCGIQADKSHQLADWRQRPLLSTMQQYAIQDTHYLLDIYERLKWDLQESIPEVLNVSRQVCLIRYHVEPFKPSGYKILLSRGRRSRTELIGRQERALKSLWDWRDEIARQQDESTTFVCTNEALLRMAMACPTTVAGLQRLFHPVPPLVLRFAGNLLDRIKEVLQEEEEDDDDAEDDNDDDEDDVIDEEEVASQSVGAPSSSSAFFKPANAAKDRRRRGMMSPVLGTEALYKQAGWMTPQEQQQQSSTDEDQGVVDVTTTGTDDDDRAEDSDKPKRMLSVHTSNKNYSSKQHAEHSMEMGKEGGGGRGRSVDGMATVRAARESSKSPGAASIEDEVKLARQNSARIRSGMAQKESIPAVLGLISPSTEVDDEEGVDTDTGAKDRDGAETDEEELAIPRSMREIYKISNRNRRNKKAGSPTPERGVTPTSEKERDELAKAEALLKERGLIGTGTGYFEENPASPGKRPRTKSRTGRESEESVPQESSSVASKEDDLAFMKEIGWIQGKEDVQTIMGQRYGRTSTEAGGDEADDQQPDPAKETNFAAYDYSAAGPMGALSQTPSSNPFFAGAAMTGGPLAQSFSRQDQKQHKKKDNKKGNQNRRQQERPKKEDGRTHAYRKR